MKRGMTVIEVLVIIAIVALLAAILIPIFTRNEAKKWEGCVDPKVAAMTRNQTNTGMTFLYECADGRQVFSERTPEEIRVYLQKQ